MRDDTPFTLMTRLRNRLVEKAIMELESVKAAVAALKAENDIVIDYATKQRDELVRAEASVASLNTQLATATEELGKSQARIDELTQQLATTPVDSQAVVDIVAALNAETARLAALVPSSAPPVVIPDAPTIPERPAVIDEVAAAEEPATTDLPAAGAQSE